MNKFIGVALVVAFVGGAFADESTNAVSTVSDLAATNAAASAADPSVARRLGLRKKVGARVDKDVEAYGKEGVREIERLYRTYSKTREVETEALETLLEKYPAANRTGCAVMYAGQRARLEGEKWFRLAIEKSSDCYYGDGACVGAYARYYLASLCRRSGRSEEAKKLIAEIKTQYPDAITHRGQLFSEILKDE